MDINPLTIIIAVLFGALGILAHRYLALQRASQQMRSKIHQRRNSDRDAAKMVAEAEAERHRHELKTKNPDGSIVCSCGSILPSLHIYHLHFESYPDIKPQHAAGWPVRQFETIPSLRWAQPGVVARGSIPYALFTTIWLKEIKAGSEQDKKLRIALSKVPLLTTKVDSFPVDGPLPNQVVSLIACAPSIWTKWDKNPPVGLKTFTEKKAQNTGQLLFPSIGGDLFLLVKATRVDLCHILLKEIMDEMGRANASDEKGDSDGLITKSSTTLGFRFNGGRDMTGFIDGTRNPDHLLRAQVDQSLIFPDDDRWNSLVYAEGKKPPPNPHAGGSFMWAGRFVHDLAKVAAMPDAEKSKIIGRDFSRVCPHRGYDQRPENPHLNPVPVDSHVARAYGAMYRQAYPYRNFDTGEEGLFFTCYSRSLSEIDQALDRMCGVKATDGAPDNLLSVTKAVTSYYYYVPSLPELESLPTLDDKGLKAHETITAHDEKEEKDERELIYFVIEYCTNCGYNTIFYEKKAVLESISPKIRVIGNPFNPRQSAFEITGLEPGGLIPDATATLNDRYTGPRIPYGHTIWSKLAQPDGRNNFPHVFPSNEHLIRKVREFIGLPEVKAENPEEKPKEEPKEEPKEASEASKEPTTFTASPAAMRDAAPLAGGVGTLYKEEGTRVGVW